MSQTQTAMTETENAPQKQLKQPFLFSLANRNETTFKIKQVATGAHFLSLICLGVFYIVKHDQTFSCFVFTAVAFSLAFFIPPTGMIKPEDTPEYAKNSLRFIPNYDGTPGTGMYDQMKNPKYPNLPKENPFDPKEDQTKTKTKRTNRKKNK